MTQMTHGQAADALDRMREESRLEAEALIALEAELWLLERFDMLRRVKLDDYGKGQRHRELARLRNDLERRGGRRYFAGTRDELRTLNADDVAAAWDRIARPRIARLRRETYRSSTRPTRMTLAAWADLQRELEADRAHRAADARGVAQAVARTLRGES